MALYYIYENFKISIGGCRVLIGSTATINYILWSLSFMSRQRRGPYFGNHTSCFAALSARLWWAKSIWCQFSRKRFFCSCLVNGRLYIIHSKSDYACGACFSASKELRKKCVNLYKKKLCQKCLNHSNLKNSV